MLSLQQCFAHTELRCEKLVTDFDVHKQRVRADAEADDVIMGDVIGQ